MNLPSELIPTFSRRAIIDSGRENKVISDRTERSLILCFLICGFRRAFLFWNRSGRRRCRRCRRFVSVAGGCSRVLGRPFLHLGQIVVGVRGRFSRLLGSSLRTLDVLDASRTLVVTGRIRCRRNRQDFRGTRSRDRCQSQMSKVTFTCTNK